MCVRGRTFAVGGRLPSRRLPMRRKRLHARRAAKNFKKTITTIHHALYFVKIMNQKDIKHFDNGAMMRMQMLKVLIRMFVVVLRANAVVVVVAAVSPVRAGRTTAAHCRVATGGGL